MVIQHFHDEDTSTLTYVVHQAVLAPFPRTAPEADAAKPEALAFGIGPQDH